MQEKIQNYRRKLLKNKKYASFQENFSLNLAQTSTTK